MCAKHAKKTDARFDIPSAIGVQNHPAELVLDIRLLSAVTLTTTAQRLAPSSSARHAFKRLRTHAKLENANSKQQCSLRSSSRLTFWTASTLFVRHVEKMVAHPETHIGIHAKLRGATRPMVTGCGVQRKFGGAKEETATSFATHATQNFRTCRRKQMPVRRKDAAALQNGVLGTGVKATAGPT